MPNAGKKAGSDRKRTPVTRSPKGFVRVPADVVLGDPRFDETEAWLTLLQATTTATVTGEDGERKQITIPDYRIRMAALMYLTDKRDGKPGQAARSSGENKAQPLEDPRLAEAVENLLPRATPEET